jgi:MarR family transcriptional regulator for hemolysin
VLLRLVEEDGLTQVEIARRQRVEAPSVCRMIDRLARDGLVARRPHPDDRRALSVTLTGAGRRVAEDGARVVADVEDWTFAGLDEDERAVLSALLGRVIDRIASPEAAT